MTLKFVIRYLLDCNSKLKKLAKQGEGSLPYLWWDFLKCAIVHGAIINHYTRGGLYKLKGCERRKSMTYRRILNVYKKCNNRQTQHLLEDKSHFNKHFNAVVKRRWCLSHDNTFTDFENVCSTSDALIVKPFDGVNGVGIKKYHVPEATEERKLLWESFANGKYIIEQCINQHPLLKIGGVKSVNTIRAFSILDKEGNVHILKTLLRVGVGDYIVDNYSAGGCVYEVDNQTGVVVSPSLTKKGDVTYIHPGTETCMLGYKLPNWEKVIESIMQAQRLIPENRFTGWDIAITENGVEFIEGNHNPGYELLEFFGTKGWWKIIKQYI